MNGGWLAPVRCFVPSSRIDTAGLRIRRGDYLPDALAQRAAAVTGDAVLEYRRRADHRPAITFCCTVAHAETVAVAFREAGYRSASVHGGTPAAERDALIAGLADGTIEVLTSCDLISEGLDVPSVGAVLLLRPTKSLVLCLQQIGRGMRPSPDKQPLIVLDHAGNTITHGHPLEERAWSLAGAPPRELRGEAPGWRCECGCLNPIGAMQCEDCGAPRPAGRRKTPEPAPGELIEIGADRYAHITRLSYRELCNQPRSRAELTAYARAHGYKRGWVWHLLRTQAETAAA